MRIKHIVIITDHRIRKQTHIQTHLEGTHLVLLRKGFDLFPVVDVLVCEKIVHRLVDPVIMPLRVRAVFRVTFRLFHKADLVLRRQYHALAAQPAAGQTYCLPPSW